MSGAVVVTPSTGAAWSTAWEQFEGIRKGMIALSLTNYDATTVPQIASGSWIECAGSIYKWTGNDTITGSLTSDAINYVILVPSGTGASAILTPTWSDSAPTWSDAYQGHYDGTTRYAGGCYYDGTNYPHKFLFDKGRNTTREFTLEIGDWNMDSTVSVDIAHNLDRDLIRQVTAYIRSDSGATDNHGMLSGHDMGNIKVTTTTVTLVRATGVYFDSTDFNATSYNRGWVFIEWETMP